MASSRKQHMRRKDKLKYGCIGLAATLFIFGGAVLVKNWEDGRYAIDESQDSTYGPFEHEPLKTYVYQGVTYEQRPNLKTYLIMGIDRMSDDGEHLANDGGQADVQMVIVVDNDNKTWQTLQINRDSMVEVITLGLDGKPFGTSRMQITLSHTYGDGKEISCENTVNTVSKFLEDQHIDGYLALNMDAVATVNDSLGGITVTVASDLSKFDPELKLGNTVTLKGEQALIYVRTRLGVDDETNLARMERQRGYLTAMERELRKQDENFILSMYDTLSKQMVTNMKSGVAADLGQKMKQYTELPLLTIAGTNTLENLHWAYIIDEDSRIKTILELFYQPKK